MNRTTWLFVGITALVAVSTIAEAADGCGRGMYYNGRRCVPQDGPSYGAPYQRDYGLPVDRGPQLRLDFGGRAAAMRDTPRRIRVLGRLTTARRVTQFRMACVSHTLDVKAKLRSRVLRRHLATVPRRCLRRTGNRRPPACPRLMFLSVRISAPLSVMTVSAPTWLMYGSRAAKFASPNPRRSTTSPLPPSKPVIKSCPEPGAKM